MCDISEVLVGVALLGKRVALARAVANNLDGVMLRVANLQLDKLSFRGRLDKFTFDLEGSTGSCSSDLIEVGHRAINHNLEGRCTTSISQLDEGEVLAAHSRGASPASNLNDMIQPLFILGCRESCDSNSIAKGESGDSLGFNRHITFKLALEWSLVTCVLGSDQRGGLFGLDLLCGLLSRVCHFVLIFSY